MIRAGDQRWHEVFERDRGHCRYCGCDLLATFEHGRLSRAHGLGHITFEARKAYLREEHLSRGTREMYEHYIKRRSAEWAN